MRALTLTQPWCGLVASGVKLVENRPRSIIKREDFGTQFALHASREIDEDVYARIREIAPELFRDDHLTDEQLVNEIPPWQRLGRITGAVIGVATVERVVDDYDRLSVILGAQRRWFFGPIGYVLRDVRALREPVPCRGHLGFWTLPADVAARVDGQLR